MNKFGNEDYAKVVGSLPTDPFYDLTTDEAKWIITGLQKGANTFVYINKIDDSTIWYAP